MIDVHIVHIVHIVHTVHIATRIPEPSAIRDIVPAKTLKGEQNEILFNNRQNVLADCVHGINASGNNDFITCS